MRLTATRFATATTVVVAILTSSLASADKLDDFKEAAGNTGCKAIPYRSERDDCESRQNDKNNICKAFSCDRAEVEKSLDKLKEKRQSLTDAKSRNNNDAVPDLERAIKDLEDFLGQSKSEARRRSTVCEDCISAREKVQKVYGSVRSSVKNENDAALQPYIDKLIKLYDDGSEAHVKPIEEVKNALENCKWVYNITY